MKTSVSYLASGFLVLLLGTINQPAAANLIENGNFESGNAGFSSDYAFSPGDLHPPAVYDVLADPSAAHPNPLAASFGDHTTGSGLMMAVNGAETAGLAVWSQTVAVSANTDYDFSAYAANWFPESPAALRFMINGSSIGILDVPSTLGVWQRLQRTWHSGPDTTATIEIVDLNTAFGGNDFALDDLSLREVPTQVPTLPVAGKVLTGLLLLVAAAWWLSRTATRQGWPGRHHAA